MSTYDQAQKAVDKYFGDTSNSRAETHSGLKALRDHIETLIEAIEADGPVGEDEG